MGVVRVGALARRTRLRARQVAAVVAVASLVSAGSKVAQAADSNAQAQANSGDAINQALLKKIEALEQRIKSLEARDKQQSTTADTTGSVKPQNKSGKHDESPAAATEPATAQAQNKAGKANTASTLDKQTDDSKAAKQAADGKAAKPADDGKTTKQAEDGKAAKQAPRPKSNRSGSISSSAIRSAGALLASISCRSAISISITNRRSFIAFCVPSSTMA
jgi:hypothetical protein